MTPPHHATFPQCITPQCTRLPPGALLLLDPEGHFTPAERRKLLADVSTRGLGLVVAAEWYSRPIMKSLAFYDDNSKQWREPVTGGANTPP